MMIRAVLVVALALLAGATGAEALTTPTRVNLYNVSGRSDTFGQPWVLTTGTSNVGSATWNLPSVTNGALVVYTSSISYSPPLSATFTLTTTSGGTTTYHNLLSVRRVQMSGLNLHAFVLPLGTGTISGTATFVMNGLNPGAASMATAQLWQNVDQRARYDDALSIGQSFTATASPSMTLNATGNQAISCGVFEGIQRPSLSGVTPGGASLGNNLVSADGYNRLADLSGGTLATCGFSFASAGTGGMIGVVLQPAGTVSTSTGKPPLPGLSVFNQNTQNAGSYWKAQVTNNYAAWVAGGKRTVPQGDPYATFFSWVDISGGYYDLTYVMTLLCAYLSDPSYCTAAAQAEEAVRVGYVNALNYGLAGYRHFEYGIEKRWQLSNTTTDPTAAQLLTEATRLSGGDGIQSGPGYTNDCPGGSGTYVYNTSSPFGNGSCSPNFQREVAYALRACIVRERMGGGPCVGQGTRAAKLAVLLAQVDYMTSNAFSGTQNASSFPGEIFVVSLMGLSLLDEYEATGNVTIPSRITAIANWIWTYGWVPAEMVVKYQANPLCTTTPCAGAFPTGTTDLNGLHVPLFGKAAVLTCDESYITKGDQVWQGSPLRGDLLSNGKQFNQSIYKALDYLTYRDTFYAQLAAGTGACAGGGDLTPPSVSITAPVDAATVSGTISVTATASDNVAVVGVQFLLDGQSLQAEDTAAPYAISWNTNTATNGAHVLSAIARDAAGNSQQAAVISVTVNNAVAPPAPTVTITAPAASATISGTATQLCATATNAQSVQFGTGNVALGPLLVTAPYCTLINTTQLANATTTITATATGAGGTASDSIAVTINNAAPQPPSVMTKIKTSGTVTLRGNIRVGIAP